MRIAIPGLDDILFQIKELIEGGQVKINDVDENNVTALRNFIIFSHHILPPLPWTLITPTHSLLFKTQNNKCPLWRI